MTVRAQKVVLLLLVLAIVGSMGFLFNGALKSHEKEECLEWRRLAEEHPNFYLLEWQLEQCKELGVKLPPSIPTRR